MSEEDCQGSWPSRPWAECRLALLMSDVRYAVRIQINGGIICKKGAGSQGRYARDPSGTEGVT
jgi:hypothetical protein